MGGIWMTAERVERRPTAVLAADEWRSSVKRIGYMWVAAAVVFAVSIGAAAAQSKSGEAAAQPKNILFLHSYGPNFQPWAAWSREIQAN